MLIGVTPASALSFFGNSIGKKIQTPSRDDGDYRLIKLLNFFINFNWLVYRNYFLLGQLLELLVQLF
jgi:hypothetical protein